MTTPLTRSLLALLLLSPAIGAADVQGDPLPTGALARLGSMKMRHGGQVTHVSVLPGGKTLLSASADWTVRVWDIATGKELRRFTHTEASDEGRLPGRTRPLFAGLSSDGKVLVTAVSSGRTIRLWDPGTGKQTSSFTLMHHLNSVSLSPDGKLIAASCTDSITRLFDPAGKELRQIGSIDAMGGGIRILGGLGNGMRFSPDGKLLLAMCYDFGNGAFTPILAAWNTETGKEAYRIKGEGGQLPFTSAPGFSPDGKLLAANSNQGEVVLVQASTGKEVRKIKSTIPRLSSLEFSRDGKTLVACGLADQAIGVWDVESGKQIRTVGEPSRGNEPQRPRPFMTFGLMGALSLSEDGKTLACAEGNIIRLINLTTGKDLLTAAGHGGPINLVSLDAQGKTLRTQSFDGTVRTWDSSGREVGQVRVPGSAYLWSLSPDGKVLLSQAVDGSVTLVDMTTGKNLRQLDVGGGVGRGIRFVSAVFSPDGKKVALRSPNEQAVRLFSVETGKELAVLTRSAAQGQPVFIRATALAFSRDSRLLASTVDDVVAIWETATGSLQREIPFPGAPVERGMRNNIWIRGLTFSLDGRTLAIDLGDFSVRVHEVATGAERRRYLRKEDAPRTPALTDSRLHNPYYLYGSSPAALSPDGCRVAMAGQDSLVHVWDAATGEEVGRLRGHEGNVLALAFSPDGTRLASCGEDALGLVWDMTALKSGKATPKTLDTAALAKFWGDLQGTEGNRSFTAICSLAGAPEQAVPFLEERLRPTEGVDGSRIDRLIADLDARRYATRKKAQEELEKLGGLAAPALTRALDGKPSEELRKRITELLDRLRTQTLSAGQLQSLRAIETLERAGTPAARAVLEKLARGATGALETIEARAALQRLK